MMSDVMSLLMIPGMVMMLGAIAVPYIPHHARQVFMLGAIATSGYMLSLGAGVHLSFELFGQSLILHRADHLTLPFGVVFHIAAAITVIYGWYERSAMTSSSGLAYGGAAIAAVHAGDLISLFFWWELTAVTSVFLIFAQGTMRANQAAVRYLLVQVASGVMLLSGAAFIWHESGSWAFEAMTLEGIGPWLVFLAFGIKAAFPLLNGWLQDAYPEATITGSVILSVFTTKMAIYALARGFAGVELLIYIGVVMATLPAIFALVENDLRRVLAYSLNNQLGFMIVAIGIGTELALNGAVAHAFVSVLYKALLFMAVGAVLLRVGTAKASALGGLYKAMPLTMVFMLIGGASIAAMPLMSGFVAKSYIMKASSGLDWVYLALMAGSVGAILHTAVKIPFFTFFSEDRGLKADEAPLPMVIGMGLAALGCVAIGVYPALLVDLLPFDVKAKIFASSPMLGQMQMIIFTLIGFGVMVKAGVMLKDRPSTLLNSDWIYRKFAPMIFTPIFKAGFALSDAGFALLKRLGKLVADLTTSMSEHPYSGPVIPGPAALVQVTLLAMILGVVYAALA